MRLRLLAAAELDADSMPHALAQLGVLFFKAAYGHEDSLLTAGRIVLVPAAAELPDLAAGLDAVALWMARAPAPRLVRPDPTPPFDAPPARPQPAVDFSARRG